MCLVLKASFESSQGNGMEWNDHKGMKMNGFRASPSEVQNVPNAKYLAIWHTKHQTPKTPFIKCAKAHKICHM